MNDDATFPPPDRYDLPLLLFLVPLTLATVAVAGLSLRWELHWDAAVMHYLGFLVNEKGFVPYRDTFDNNMFGVPALHILAGRLFGYDDFGMRAFDLLWLAVLSLCSWALLRRFGWRATWPGVVLFAWLYLTQGESQLLQRDYLTVLPTAAAVLVAVSGAGRRPWLSPLVIGLLIGLAATLKPPAAIVLPVLAGFGPATDEEADSRWHWWRRLIVCELLAGVGFVVPVAAGLLWLAGIGALPGFVEIVSQYYPLYTKHVFAGGIRTATAAERREFVLESILTFRNLGGRQLLVVSAALIGLVQLLNPGLSRQRRALVLLLALLALTQYAGIIIVGNFHPYSWLPMLYFLVLLLALGFARPFPIDAGPASRLALPLVAVLGAVLSLGGLPDSVRAQLRGEPPETVWTQRADAMVRYLEPRLQPGDTVQPLDHLGGTARALLRCRAGLATRFAEDCFFYLGSDQPYVRQLRGDFLQRLERSPPRFVILVTRDRLFTTDPADKGDFDATLRRFLATRYHPGQIGDGYVIYERND